MRARGVAIASYSSSTIFLPFLYQTRTISTLPSSKQAPRALLAVRSTQISRGVHSSSAKRSSENGSWHGPNSAATQKPDFAGDGLRIKRVASAQREPRDVIRKTGQKEDLSSGYRKLDLSRIDQDDIRGNTDGAEMNDLDFRSFDVGRREPQDEFWNEANDDIKADTYERPTRAPRESTITSFERSAFQELFDRVGRSGRTLPEDGLFAGKSASEHGNAEGKLTSIDKFLESMKRSRRPILDFDGKTIPEAQQEIQAAIAQYPPVLRKDAASAIRNLGASSNLNVEASAMSSTSELEELRAPERERVEALMRAAPTDLELWKVMETEVFSMIKKYGLAEKEPGQPVKKARKKKGTLEKAVDQTVPSAVAEAEPEHLLDITIHGPLYPSHLLLGLRLLDRSFSKPSPLTSNVLPRIKSLGLVSHVLGASTSLYNELIRIHWLKNDDYRTCLNLLDEMDQAGLDLNKDTMDIVDSILQMQSLGISGKRGTAIKRFWETQEFRPKKFWEWKEKIEKAMAERSAEISNMLSWEADRRRNSA